MTDETKELPQDPTRRDFIKKGALAAAGFMIVPRYVLGGKGYIAPSDKLVVASVGCGGKGQSDIAYFNKTGKATIAFLCDVDEKQAVLRHLKISPMPNAIRTGARCLIKNRRILMLFRFQHPIIRTR